MSIVLSLDAMGGDKAPSIVLEGANLFLQNESAFFRLFGDQKVLAPLMAKFPDLSKNSEIIHTDEVVTNDTKPMAALRGLPQSSMRLAIKDVQEGRSQGVISAGNTGAYMALSKIILKTIEGVDRPAIAAILPSLTGTVLGLDLGANVECSADNLIQFAVMGDVAARRILQKPAPRIGLLNVGTEELKGSAAVQQAAQRLHEIDFLNYIGFVEGNDLTSGKADIVVTDGFTGNVALKAIEGTAKFIANEIKTGFQASLRGKLSYMMAIPVIEHLKKRMDPRLYNGAIFIGLQGIAVKSHGGADGIAFANAIKITVDLSRKIINSLPNAPTSRPLVDEIRDRLIELDH